MLRNSFNNAEFCEKTRFQVKGGFRFFVKVKVKFRVFSFCYIQVTDHLILIGIWLIIYQKKDIN